LGRIAREITFLDTGEIKQRARGFGYQHLVLMLLRQ
jgi:hypothetical protein